MKKSPVRASILVTRWRYGSEGGIDGQTTERVSLPLAQVTLVEPHAQEIWASLAESRRELGSCRSRISLTGTNPYIIVTETVDEIDALMNTPITKE
jgi:hypothetical protein